MLSRISRGEGSRALPVPSVGSIIDSAPRAEGRRVVAPDDSIVVSPAMPAKSSIAPIPTSGKQRNPAAVAVEATSSFVPRRQAQDELDPAGRRHESSTFMPSFLLPSLPRDEVPCERLFMIKEASFRRSSLGY